MAKPTTNGMCNLCGKSFSKPGISRHLKRCREENRTDSDESKRAPGRNRPGFHLAVEGLLRPEYWMHLEIAGNESLEYLDYFLRQTWLECCGHLSAFAIRGKYYFREDRGIWARLEDMDMDVSLSQVLRPGTRFIHEYDFGDTTELALRVVSQGNLPVGQNGARLLARNEPPEVGCVNCDSMAATLCIECSWIGVGYSYCDQCFQLHGSIVPTHKEMVLPVVNSPRMGECAYTGPESDE